MRVISFDPGLVRPLAKQLLGVACSVCDKPQAVWSLVHAAQGQDAVCSMCLLYKSRWATTVGTEREAFMADVEEARQIKFERDVHGLLVDVEDANRLMFAIVLAGKLGPQRRGG